jgi:lipopolysaccharide export system protein LptA
MLYDDAARRASYKTGASLDSPDGNIKATSILVYLATTGNAVDRLEATGAVTLSEPERVTTGDVLHYVAKDDTYTMTGALVKMVEKGCRTSIGTVLQFAKSTDKLRIDGNDDTRTQTKNADCPPTPSK